MRSTLILICTALVGVGCNNQNENSETADANESAELVAMHYYGDTITADGALTAEAFRSKIAGTDSVPVKLEAKINETCKMKGCWMTVDLGNGEEMRVKFKDYGFFVPKEGANGKVAIMEGYAFTDTISVDHLRHLAEDAGRSAEEIAAISEPEIGVNFEATGVIIKD